MLKIIKLSSFLFFIFFQHLFADVISKITVEGNKRITKETIIVYGGIDKSKEMTKESLDTITKKMRAIGSTIITTQQQTISSHPHV